MNNSFIIKKITQLNYRIYQGSLWKNAEPMSRYNLFFGLNGAGKSTMARGLESLSRGDIPNDFAINLRIGNEAREYDISASNDSPLSLVNTFVFNYDYIENICNLSTEGLDSILHIHKKGRKQIDNILRIKAETKILFGSLKEAARLRRTKIGQMDVFLEEASKGIAKITGWQYAPAASDIYYKLKNYECDYAIEEAIRDKYKLASHYIENSSNQLKELPYCACDPAEIFARAAEQIEQMQNSSLSEYVFYIDNLIKFQEQISKFINRVLSIARTLNQTENIFPSLLSDYRIASESLKSECSRYLGYLEMIVDTISRAKRRNFTDTEVPFVYLEDINSKIDIVNSIFLNHNKICSNAKLAYIFACEYITEYSMFINADKFKIIDNDLELSKLLIYEYNEKIKALNFVLAEIYKEIDYSDELATYLTTNLAQYLGRNELTFELSKNGYIVKRNNKPARWLSEGEKTALSFIYFVFCVEKSIGGVNNSIIILDDPVSSFDASSMYNCVSFIQSRFENAAQLIVLTHNFLFFQTIKRQLTSLVKRSHGSEKLSCYTIERFKEHNNRVHPVIKNASNEVLNYSSEYVYLFKVVITCSLSSTCDNCKIGCYPMVNIGRRLLETFLSFKYPSRQSINDMVMATDCSMECKKTLYMYLNDLSHSNSLDRSMYDCSIIENTRWIMKSIIEVIKSDFVHFKEMLKVCNISSQVDQI